jgi:hypothetical protein
MKFAAEPAEGRGKRKKKKDLLATENTEKSQ